MKVIIDRFEEDIAVIELGENMLNVPRILFPEANEGDTVEITVLGKVQTEGEEAPRAIFERLRKKSRKKSAKKTPSPIVSEEQHPKEQEHAPCNESATDIPESE